MSPFLYALHGMTWASDLALGELMPAPPGSPVDVSVELRPLSRTAPATGLEPTPEGVRLSIEGVADFIVGGGRRIIVEPQDGAAEENIRLYLLGSALGLLLHQRGLFPLHATAVEVDGAAVAFMGPSGAGKSTLGLWFHDRGCAVIAEDVCVIDTGGGPPTVHWGLPRLRLSADVLHASGRSSTDYRPSFRGDKSTPIKFDFALPHEGGRGPLRLRGIYLLSDGALELTRLAPGDAASEIIANTYRGGWVGMAGDAARHWQACVKLARDVPVHAFSRQLDHSLADVQNQALLAHVRGLSGPS